MGQCSIAALRRARQSQFIVADNRPVAIAGAAPPSQKHRVSFDGGFQCDAGKRSAVGALLRDPQRNRSFGTHINVRLGVLAALGSCDS